MGHIGAAQPVGPDESLPIPQIDLTLCNGCGLCARVCPGGALVLQQGQAVLVRVEACAYSGWCEQICPVGAIQLPLVIVASDEGYSRSKDAPGAKL